MNLPDGTAITYVHDPLGRRIAKKINGTITEKYLWSGLTTLLAVYDGSDNLLMRFRYADGRMPVAVEKAGATYYLAYGQVGTPRAVADAAGNIVKQVEYDSWGYLLNDTNPSFEIPFGFAGGLYDKDTGLVRFGYRDYDPDTGRWTAKDPIGFAGGDSDLYGYVLCDPINLVDIFGLSPQDRVNWALNQYNNNKDYWKGNIWPKGYNFCNEFVAMAHTQGDPDAMSYPTVLRENGYFYPTVSDLANPCFDRGGLDYLQISDVQPGDIVVWYGNGHHHAALAIGNGEVIYQHYSEGVKRNSITDVNKAYGGLQPIVRRYKY